MTEPQASLARYVVVDLSNARVAKVWEGVSTELLRRPRPRLGWVASAGTAVVIALLGASWHHVRARTPESSAVARELVATAGEARTVDLGEGLRVELSAHTRVRLSRSEAKGGDRVAVEVDRGTVVSAALQASQEDGATAGSNEPEVGVTP
jgi:ferric-dicitrate binding protein FerR (iron transport regulator)